MLRVKILVECEVISDSGCGLAKHIWRNGSKSHIADGKSILETVFLAALHGCELVAVAGQLTEDADILIGDKAALYKTNTKEIPRSIWNP